MKELPITKGGQMTETIKACNTCSYYDESPDPLFSTCKYWKTYSFNYINGEVYESRMNCVRARQNEDFCGHTAIAHSPIYIR